MNTDTKRWSTQKLIFTGMLAAVAGVLMSLEFSIPLMPPFYKVDFSDVPTLVAIFMLGPVPAICVEVIKLLIKLFTVGTNSMYVGEVANLLSTLLYVIPLWLIYKKMGSTKKAAWTAMGCSIIIRTVAACLTNAFVSLPLYAAAMGITVNQIVQMVSGVNPAIHDLNSFIILATIPFNLIKIGLNYLVGEILYSSLLASKVVPKTI